MEECFVVEVDGNYPSAVPVVDPALEIVHVYSAGLFSHGNQVITIAPPSSSSNGNEMHPLEAEVQRGLDVRRQNELARLNSSSVIQTLANATRPVRQLTSLTSPLQQVLNIENTLASSSTDMGDKNNDSGDHRETKVLWFPDPAPMDAYTDHNPESDSLQSKEDEVAQIPLTVQACCQTADSQTESQGQDSASEDENEEMTPVYDYEPDPEAMGTKNLDETTDMTNRCYMCFKKFRQRKNMYAHIRKIHSTQPKIQGGIVCPLCKMHALRQEHLRNHLETLHDIKIAKEERQFNSMKDFLTWKEYVERETLSLFISKSSPKLLAFNQTKNYYKCHRSGVYFASKGENRKKRLKSQGSSKIGATCPAAMEVIENSSGVTVIFWSTHVGHTHDLKHLMLYKGDRAMIGELLNSGMSSDEVLETIQSERSTPSRLDVVSKQDLKNLKNEMVKTSLQSSDGVIMGRKPRKERMLRSASQALVLDKAEILLNVLQTNQIIPEFRPQVCLMIDNLISTVKRRTVNNRPRSNTAEKRRLARELSPKNEEKSEESNTSHKRESQIDLHRPDTSKAQHSPRLKRSKRSLVKLKTGQ